MNATLKKSLLLAAAAAAPFAAALAAPQPAIPASSSIAAKLDFAKARSLPATSAAIDWLFANVTTLRQGNAAVASAFGLDPKSKLDSVQAFSDGFTFDGQRVALKNAAAFFGGLGDTAKLADALRSAAGFKRAKAGEIEVMTADLAKGFWLAFPESGSLALASSDSAMAKAMAARDGRAKTAPADSLLAKALSGGDPAVLAIDGSNGAANLSLLGGIINDDAKSIVARIKEPTPGNATVEINLDFADPAAATRTFASINGLKLLAALQQAKNPNKKTDPLVQKIIESNIAVNGSGLDLSMPVTASDFASAK